MLQVGYGPMRVVPGGQNGHCPWQQHFAGLGELQALADAIEAGGDPDIVGYSFVDPNTASKLDFRDEKLVIVAIVGLKFAGSYDVRRRLTAGWVMCRASAAAEIEPCSWMLTKVRSSCRFINTPHRKNEKYELEVYLDGSYSVQPTKRTGGVSP